MLKWMFQPSTTFITSAMAYMLMPDIKMVMNAEHHGRQRRAPIRRNAVAGSPGTECVFEM